MVSLNFIESNTLSVWLLGDDMSLEFEWEAMKKTRSAKRSSNAGEELLAEYRFDYRKARPNRFAAQLKQGCRAVLLDPDVAEIFTTRESVNSILRALIVTMPKRRSS